MTQNVERTPPVDRRAQYVKWLIFGVVLPLLPFAARALAAWVDNSSSSLSFTVLLGDGELLVVATVIAAAIIGDLLFDFTGNRATRTHTSAALMCAFALVIVVASVLMFGLVTLDNQHRNDAVLLAQQSEISRIGESSQLLANSAADQRTASGLSPEAQRLTRRVAAVQAQATREATGADGIGLSGASGYGPLYRDLVQQELLLRRQARIATARANTESAQAIGQRQRAGQILSASFVSLRIGRRQAALMSVIMFLIAFSAGCVSLRLPIDQTDSNELKEIGDGDLSTEDPS
jgi:hypothetical protein